ncbi:helix-turn-helix domain-containing protein [Nocardia elegans]|uniref:Helix-turn-helix domain-containing protein n=1 Tax=Nocardia elegans TaxID=300029 RepID=A0ABW6TE13_9NOCA
MTATERAEIIAKYEAGASLVQLRVEHHMAKRTVTTLLREAGVTIRPRGGRRR